MLPDTGIDDVKKQRDADYAKHINDPVLSSLNMEGIRLIVIFYLYVYNSTRVSYKTMSQTDTNTETGDCMYGEGLLMMSA
jgi:hypothetical protein